MPVQALKQLRPISFLWSPVSDGVEPVCKPAVAPACAAYSGVNTWHGRACRWS